ncbi:MAG: YdcH family protein [Sulfurospirillaceae bacterium]|nr:YdcH family protein [Sulfurospirillaceae bacterium]
MLHEYREIISKIKVENAHFAKIFEKHNELDQKIADVEEGREHLSDVDLDTMKKEKLRLKDEAYAMIIAYKKENNL